jgi:hypothetical protein
MNTQEAIDRSISHNEIVTLRDDRDDDIDLELLEDSCDDWNYEFWGKDDIGNDWRVHTIVDRLGS